MSRKKEYTLAEIAEFIGSKVIGDCNAVVSNIATLESATNDSISFLSNKKYHKYIKTTLANAVIVSNSYKIDNKIDNKINYLISEDPYLSYAKLTTLFKKTLYELDNPIVHPSAVISSESKIGNDVSIGANVVIGPNCIIGDSVIIKSNCSIVQDVEIGEFSVIHNGSVLGSDGFGYAPSKNGYIKIEQLGKLVVGKNVEIGASCTIDRGSLDNTEIHDGVKLDNQIQIAHNVVLGKNSAIAASCAIAGSTVIGKNFQMGGLSGVLGHLSICDDVTIGAHTLITKSINNSGNYIGIMPAQTQKNWAKSAVFIKKRV